MVGSTAKTRHESRCYVELVQRETLTLGTRKVTPLLTRGNGTVDMAAEGDVGQVAELVVGLDVLLDGLTAAGKG